MTKDYLRFTVILIFFFTSTLSAQDRNLWSRISESSISDSELRHEVKLAKFESFELKTGSLRNELKNAPKREEFAGKSMTKIQFPDENGKMEIFLIKESSVMDPVLAQKFPENKSYVGVSEKDASKRIHFSLNQLGLNAIIMDTKGGVRYIEPLSKDKKKYKAYYRRDIQNESSFECFTENIEFSTHSTGV